MMLFGIGIELPLLVPMDGLQRGHACQKDPGDLALRCVSQHLGGCHHRRQVALRFGDGFGEAIDGIHPGRQRSHVGARTTLAEEINMRDIIEDRRVLRMQFEAFAHNARNESGKPESGYCFDALAASVDEVSPELLEAYVEMFQKIEHRKIGSALRQSIQQGLWLPTSATEYMQRFIAFASGTGTPS